MSRKLYLLLSCMTLLVVSATPAMAHDGGGHTFTLSSLNGSGAQGEGTVLFEEDTVTVSIEASGLEPGQVHEFHIHGIEGQDVGCPTDADGDGMVSHDEAKQQTGGHLLDLEPYPTADNNGNISFEHTYTEGVDGLAPIGDRAIMAHGTSMNGEYMTDMAAACGEISPAAESAAPSTIPETGGINPGLIYALVGAGAVATGAAFLGLMRRNL